MEDRRRGTEKVDTKSVSVVAIPYETKNENVKSSLHGKSDLRETSCKSSSDINTEIQMDRLLNISVPFKCDSIESLNLGEETY